MQPKGGVQETVEDCADEIDGLAAHETVRWGMERYGSKLILASSFGAEDVVLIDMAARAGESTGKSIRIVTLDTGRLHQETYDVMDAIRARYELTIEVFSPQAEPLQQMVHSKGLNLFYHSTDDRKQCCGVRKMEPLRRALSGADAWMTGLRREQNVTRSVLRNLEWDAGNNLAKINPLHNWSWDDVWDYIRTHDVPYNVLHDEGFPSIGCAPCTRAISAGDDLRAGRWWWELPETKECGLHLPTASSNGAEPRLRRA